MASHSTGVFTIPVPSLTGEPVYSGTYTLPLFVIEGRSGVAVEPFVLPRLILTGASASRDLYGDFKIPVPSMIGTIITPTQRSSGLFVLPGGVVTGRSHTGSKGVFVLPIPGLSDILPQYSRGSLIIPPPDFTGFGRCVPISKIYKGVAMNISNQAISAYNAFPFNSISYFDGHYYGARDDGIYLLEGDKDGASYIQSKIKTGLLNLGNNFLKYLRDIWLTYRSDGHLAVVLATKEDESDRTEEFPTEIAGNDIHEERVPGPRGLRGRYYIVELKNLSGANFDIEQISIMVDAIRKKIR